LNVTAVLASLRGAAILVWHLSSFISAYGAVLVGAMIAVECMCIPVPGETVLLTAAIYAGRTHDLNIWSVFGAGVLGAIFGNLVAFWIGRKYGYKLLWRYGGYLHLTRPRLKIGQYLFFAHGGKFIVFARFIPVLRSFAAALTGANRMPPWRFLAPNLLGALVWVGLECGCAYYLGEELKRVALSVGIALACCVLFALGLAAVLLTRYEGRLALIAERRLLVELREAGGELG
jgi:membrane protein DedA with SNARE-associated domain